MIEQFFMIHSITNDEDIKTIFVSQGDVIEIQLKENPTTGYTWAMDDVSPFFTVHESEYALQTEKALGSSGFRIFRFLVEQTGTGEIRLKKWQARSGSVGETFTLQVQSA